MFTHENVQVPKTITAEFMLDSVKRMHLLEMNDHMMSDLVLCVLLVASSETVGGCGAISPVQAVPRSCHLQQNQPHLEIGKG